MEIISIGEENWFFLAIYADPNCSKRQELWEEISLLTTEMNGAGLLAGDFNETISLKEQHDGDVDMQRRCDKFKLWIANNGLIDLGFSGPRFTWNRGKTMETRKSAYFD